MSYGRDLRNRPYQQPVAEKSGGKKPDKMTLISGGIILLIGFYQLISVAILTILRSEMDVIGLISSIVFCVSGYKIMLGKEKVKKEKKGTEPGQRPSRQNKEEEQWKQYIPKPVETKSSGFSFKANDHRHILPTGISVEKQLEQLDVLLGAGLYTKEEYRAAKAKILSRR